MAAYRRLHDEYNFEVMWIRNRRRNAVQHHIIDIHEDRPIDNMTLLNPYVRWYFFIAGQWFAPVEKVIKRRNLPRAACRIAYAVWQAIVVLVMWSFFLYSMGFLKLRTLQEVDWLCPLTDIKNMVHGLCWIVNQHTGLLFFSVGNLENLLMQLSITREEVYIPGGKECGRGGTGPGGMGVLEGLVGEGEGSKKPDLKTLPISGEFEETPGRI